MMSVFSCLLQHGVADSIIWEVLHDFFHPLHAELERMDHKVLKEQTEASQALHTLQELEGSLREEMVIGQEFIR